MYGTTTLTTYSPGLYGNPVVNSLTKIIMGGMLIKEKPSNREKKESIHGTDPVIANSSRFHKSERGECPSE